VAEPRRVDEEVDLTDVGRRLRAARARAGLTRKQLAAASGTSERYLAHLEAGTGNPTIGVLKALADSLDLVMADLLPAGGERNERRAAAAALLRRLPEARLQMAVEWLQRPAAPDLAKRERITLIGLRGAGKSSLGAALAQRLDVPFVEMSREVEQAYGGEMGLLIEIGGQSALRRYEHEAWESILDRYDSAVIATPGGIVADGQLFERILESAHGVWLEATPEDHMSRVMAQGDFRPMAGGRGAMEDLKAILAARAPEYARAEQRLNTSAQSFDETVERLELIGKTMVGKREL
jgi:XRE family aerobic/anaerobic benzoate catabolism transcriptional regulator